MLQVAMGWENAHLYVFRLTINEKTIVYGIPDPDWASADIRIRDSRRTKLDATVWAEWLKLTYEYDLGDSWMHQITIERIEHLAEDEMSEDALWVTPRCLAGERACPPEDSRDLGRQLRLCVPHDDRPLVPHWSIGSVRSKALHALKIVLHGQEEQEGRGLGGQTEEDFDEAMQCIMFR